MASAFAHALIGGAIGLLSAVLASARGTAGSRDSLSPSTARAAAAASPAVSLDPAELEPAAPEPETPAHLPHAKDLSRRLIWLCAVFAVLPDADTLMHLFVPYDSPFGHRGALHSPVFYAALAAATCSHTYFRGQRIQVFLATFLALLSHSALDMLTDGGLGVAIFWPLSDARHFFEYRPLPVSPLSVSAFFSARGLHILSVELPLTLPIFAGALFTFIASKPRRPSPSSSSPSARLTETPSPNPIEAEPTSPAASEADDVVVLEIEEHIDLHSFAPRDILDVVEAYLEAAGERGFEEVRLIHGRGKGVQRARIRQLLSAHPDVLSFKDAPHTRGGWGATLVWLKQPTTSKSPRQSSL